MCGLAGVILGKKLRRMAEIDEIREIFTDLLLLNQSRGKHAAGVAAVNRDGTYSLFKRPGPASALVGDGRYSELIDGLDNRATVILGHTRLKTRGSEANNANNHPIRAGNVLGCGAGTILNADALFRRYRLPRFAEVDSEIIFRMADTSRRIDTFLNRLKNAQGALSAVFTKITRPDTIYAVKGNRPLTLWYHERFRAVFYSSEEWPLEAALGDMGDVQFLEVDPFTLCVFRMDDLLAFTQYDLEFIPQKRRAVSWKSSMCYATEL